MTDIMTAEEIAKVQAALDGITPLPWDVLRGVPPHGKPSECFVGDSHAVALCDERGAMDNDLDAHAIVATMNAAPQLLATIEALRAENERIKAALQDSFIVHTNILRGEITLTREHALHIACATDYDTLRSSLSAAEERIAGLQEALSGLLEEHDTCDTGEGSPEGCTLLADLSEVYHGTFPNATTNETGGDES